MWTQIHGGGYAVAGEVGRGKDSYESGETRQEERKERSIMKGKGKLTNVCLGELW